MLDFILTVVPSVGFFIFNLKQVIYAIVSNTHDKSIRVCNGDLQNSIIHYHLQSKSLC